MIDRMSLTCRTEKALSLVIGLRPMFASVAPIIARSRAGHQDRALAEVDVERRLDLFVDDAEVQEQVRDGAVAVAGAPLGVVDGLVHRQLPPGDAR